MNTTRVLLNRTRFKHLSPWAVAATLLTLLLCGLGIAFTIRNTARIEEMALERLIMQKSGQINDVISRLLYKTQVLNALVIQDGSGIHRFQKVAEAIVDDPAIMNILIAPGGIVTDAYPLPGNEEVIGLDFFSEKAGNREAMLAKAKNTLILGGPFNLVQGGQGLVGRYPVWNNNNPDNGFWGLVSVTLKYPEALAAADLDSLPLHGFYYEIWRVNPDDNQRQTIAGIPNLEGKRPSMERAIRLFDAEWHFVLAPVYLWYLHPLNWVLIAAGLSVALLLGAMVQNNHHLSLMKEKLEKKEGDLQRSVLSEQEANRMKTTFLANMSHEIRTPMNGIVGLADLAMDDTALPPKSRDYLAKIKASSAGLLSIINDILDISKIETGRMEFEHVPFELHDVFTICETLEKPKAKEKRLDLHFYAEPLVGARLVGDPGKLRQILVNLMDNAIKFTNRGGVKVKALAENRTADSVDIRFEVRDTGIGMTAEQQRLVCEPFVQADSGKTRRYGGAGLGLSICKSFIESMGGKLRVESVPGVGSSFEFTLRFPLVPLEKTAPAATPPLPEMRPIFSGEVLVCEDNDINQDVILENLSRIGLTATLAENGRIGVDLVRQRASQGRQFDLILMDIHMPELDGIDATRQILSLGVTTPVVALTANIMARDRASYRDVGMVDCLGKPFEPQELWACLQKFLEPVDHVPIEQPAQEEAPAELKKTQGNAVDHAVGLQRSAGNSELHQRLLRNFMRDNQNVLSEIRAALTSGDVRLAHRKAHTLKGVAGLIGATRLSEAAFAVEESLYGGEDHHSEEQLEALGGELGRVFAELTPVETESRTESRRDSALDRDQTTALADRLAPLLASGDVDSLEMLDEIGKTFAPLGDIADTLVAQIEDYEFEDALATLNGIREQLQQQTQP